MWQTSLSSLGPAKSVCAGAKVWRKGEVWRGARGRARDEGWEKDKGKDRERQSYGRNRGRDGQRQTESWSLGPGWHLLTPEIDLCSSYKWELLPLQYNYFRVIQG